MFLKFALRGFSFWFIVDTIWKSWNFNSLFKFLFRLVNFKQTSIWFQFGLSWLKLQTLSSWSLLSWFRTFKNNLSDWLIQTCTRHCIRLLNFCQFILRSSHRGINLFQLDEALWISIRVHCEFWLVVLFWSRSFGFIDIFDFKFFLWLFLLLNLREDTVDCLFNRRNLLLVFLGWRFL